MNIQNKLSPKMTVLIEKARDLFLRFGIKRVSIEEICREAKVSKVTFYKNFADKKKLIQHIIEKAYAEHLDAVLHLRESAAPFMQKLQKILFVRTAHERLFDAEFTYDALAAVDRELAQYLEEEKGKELNEIRLLFLDAQRNGELRADIKIDFLMYMFIHIQRILADEEIRRMYPEEDLFRKEVFSFFSSGALAKK